MQLRKIIILLVILVILGLIYIPILSNSKEDKKATAAKANVLPVLVAKNIAQQQTLSAYGQVTPNLQLTVTLEVQGKLKKGNKTLKAGSKFRKGEILYSIDRIEQLYALFARRSAYQSLVSSILPDLMVDYPEVFTTWKKFANAISEDKALPALPQLRSTKEKTFVNSRNILSEYYNIKASETRLDKYFYVAPFNGTVVSIMAEPGSMINPGTPIASIIKSSDYEVKVPIKKKELELFKKASDLTYTTPTGDEIGRGKIKRISGVLNTQTQSIDVYLSISPYPGKEIYQGDFVNLNTNIKLQAAAVTVPNSAVNNGQIQLLKNKLIKQRAIQIIGEKSDSLFVTGISNDEIVVIEPVLEVSDTIKFIGIQK